MEKKYFGNHAVYQIYPRSFCDGNGDGIGDIPGIISKLDYLSKLGIGIIWLSPVYASPNSDMGYDISDYLSINPDYGTMEDMEELIAKAKEKGIRIIMDLVVNHTSDEHSWFKQSKDKNSPYHSYYYWRKGKNNNKLPPNNWTSMFGGGAWSYCPEVGEYYLHLYGEKQPDLDWHNPAVYEEVKKIITFWLDKGIYGFRCDVINQIWKETLKDGKKTPMGCGMEHYLMKEGNHEILRRLNKDIFSKRDVMVVGETYMVDHKNGVKFLNNELDMFFEFDHTNVDKWKLPLFPRKYHPSRMKDILYGWQKAVSWNALYFENHDQLRSIKRFGEEGALKKVSGKMLATILFTLRGTPFIYEGEEIGMSDLPIEQYEEYRDVSAQNVYKILERFHFSKSIILKLVHNFNRDNARSPMQWDDSPNGGFSKKTPWITVNPNYKEVNVVSSLEDPDSIWHYYEKLIALRKNNDALSYGSFLSLKSHRDIMVFRRDSEKEAALVVINLSKKKRKLPSILKISGKVLISNYPDYLTSNHTLRPFEAAIIALKKVA